MEITSPRKKNFGIAIIALAAAVVLAYIIAIPRPVTVEITQARKKTFRETIQSDGILRSKERFIVPAFADGDIKRVSLKVGDRVKKGQTVAELFWDVKYEPVRSPIDGVISKVFRESAGPIRRGEPIVEVINPEKLEAIVEILTNEATRVKPGNPALVEGWGENIPLQARVTRVSKAGFTKQSALGVEEEKTEISLDLLTLPKKILERLGSNFHIEVSIEIGQEHNALVIPVGALFRNGENWAVYVVRGERAHLTQVTVGARSQGDAVIENGLNAGDSVIVFPGDLVKDGTRVRMPR